MFHNASKIKEPISKEGLAYKDEQRNSNMRKLILSE